MFRQTPISVMIVGAPKIGKSHLVIKFTSDLNAKLFNVRHHTFCMTSTTEHMDGYVQQPIVVLDDHYKLSDGQQKNDASIVFNMMSCTTYYPSFALITNKGMHFDSKFVLITSNFAFPRTIFLSSALHRRHKHHVIAIKTKQFAIDFSHLELYYTREIIDPWNGNYQYPFSEMHDFPVNVNEFKLFPFRERYVRVSYDKLIEIVVEDYRSEEKFFKGLFL